MMGFVKMIMRKIAPIPRVEEHKRFLFIGPHPDDVEIGAGGTAARLAGAGKSVHVLIATNGCCGAEKPDITRQDIAAVRAAEAAEAAKKIGAESLHILPFDDGGLYDQTEFTKSIAAYIAKIKPDVVFCPDHLLRTECHIDHLKTGLAASNAFLMCQNRLIMEEAGSGETASPQALAYYFTDTPNRYIKISKENYQTQIRALSAHESQVSARVGNKSFLDLMKIYISFRQIRFGFKTVKGRAEGFRVLSNTHAHCCAERL